MTNLIKRSHETRYYTMIATHPEVTAGDLIASVVSVVVTIAGVVTADITTSNIGIGVGSKSIVVKCAGGIDTVDYIFTFTFLTVSGLTLECVGGLLIKDS